MVDRSEFIVTFSARDKNLASALDRVGQDAQKTGKQIEQALKRADKASSDFGNRIEGLQKRIVSLGASLAVALVARQGISDAVKFGKAIAEVGTIADVSAEDLRGLRQETTQLAASLGLDEVDVASGLYQTLSAGITDSADALLVLENAAELAVGGVSNTNATVDLLTSVLNAYRLEAEASQQISDQLFETVRLGKTTIDELAASIGTVAPIAATVGVEFTELAAAISTTTLSGLSTAESATQVRAVITALGKKVKEVREVFKGVNKEFSFTDIRTRGLVPILQDLRDALDDDSEALINLLGRQEAVNAVFNLTGQNLETYQENLRKTAAAQESVTAALGIQFDSASGRVEKQLNALSIRFEEIADSFFEGLAKGPRESVEEIQESLKEIATPSELERESAGFLGNFLESSGLAAQSLFADLKRVGLIIGDAFGQENKARISELTREIEELAEAQKFVGFDVASDSPTNLFGFEEPLLVQAKLAFDEANEQERILGEIVAAARKVQEEQKFFEAIAEGPAKALEAERQAIAALIVEEEKLKASQDELFGNERLSLITKVTTNFDLQREAISTLIDAEFERINALEAEEKITSEQRDTLADLLEAIELEKLEKIASSEATKELREQRLLDRETTKGLRVQVDLLRAAQAESGITTNELTSLFNRLQAAARDADVEGVEKLTKSIEDLIEEEQGFGASFVRGLERGQETLSAIGENFGQNIGGAFSQLTQDLAAGEDGFENFKDTAIRAIGQVAAELLTLAIVRGSLNVFGGGGVQAFSGGGVQSFAGGGTTAGGKPINFGSFPIGGVVRDPTVALFGDQSNAFKGEAFVPIPGDAQGIPVDFRGAFPMTNGGTTNNITLVLDVDAIDSKSLQERLAQRDISDLLTGLVEDGLRSGGSLRESVQTVSRSA